MRCMACGAEMFLVNAIADISMPVAGFERRAYMCSQCNDTEQRLVFNKRAEQPEAATAHASVAPAPTYPNLIQSAKNLVSLARAK
jgi:hypothetical protein